MEPPSRHAVATLQSQLADTLAELERVRLENAELVMASEDAGYTLRLREELNVSRAQNAQKLAAIAEWREAFGSLAAQHNELLELAADLADANHQLAERAQGPRIGREFFTVPKAPFRNWQIVTAGITGRLNRLQVYRLPEEADGEPSER